MKSLIEFQDARFEGCSKHSPPLKRAGVGSLNNPTLTKHTSLLTSAPATLKRKIRLLYVGGYKKETNHEKKPEVMRNGPD